MNSTLKHRVKDSVFTTLFGTPKYTLDMYRSLHPEDTDVTESDIDIITIENILVNGIFNDLGFRVKNKILILVEAQSTFSIKLSIRLLLYFAASLKKYIDKTEMDLYSDSQVLGYNNISFKDEKKIKTEPLYYLPKPEFYVIYTGNDENVPDELDIADMYEPGNDSVNTISMKVKIIKSSDKNDCIGQYIRFCKAANIMREKYRDDRHLAARELVKYCLGNNILKEFINDHEKEVYSMLDVLFDQEYVTRIHEENLIVESEARGTEKTKMIFRTISQMIKSDKDDEFIINSLCSDFTLSRDDARNYISDFRDMM